MLMFPVIYSLAQAKTGTGKTLAFLVPVLQNIFKDPSLEKRSASKRSTPADIRAIVISPTRELAEQIAMEARKLAQGTGVVVQTAVGGTRKREGLQRIQMEGCHLLVGTPGRLKDILSDSSSGVKAPKLSALVLDEADRLLDQGFAPEIMEIQTYLPDPMKVDRQTLLFSATVPREVMSVVRRTMKPNFKFVKTVKEDEAPTHLRVPQKVVRINGLENSLPALLELTKNYLAKQREDPNLPPFKAIAYFNSTAQVTLAYEAFRGLLNDPSDRRSGHPLGRMFITEMHSRLTQGRRTRNSDSFRNARSGLMLSSDVTARGMDFPNVTHVIQVGVSRDRESYIHRLGRTARANKEGEGWIFVHPGEQSDFRLKLGDLPIEKDTSLQTAAVDMTAESQELPQSVAETLSQVSAAVKRVPAEIKTESYRSHIGVLVGVFEKKAKMMQALNDLAIYGYGLPEPPHISPEVASKLGLRGVAGVNSGSDSRPVRADRSDRGDAPWMGRGRFRNNPFRDNDNLSYGRASGRRRFDSFESRRDSSRYMDRERRRSRHEDEY